LEERVTDQSKVLITRDGPVAQVTINRPNVANAFDGETISALIDAFHTLGEEDSVRVIVLTGAGGHFCAGADLKWMMKLAQNQAQLTDKNANVLAGLFDTVNKSPKPVIGRINGAVRGGGLGLVAACDIPIAISSVNFAFTEVRLGLAPAVISPYVISRIGIPAARELFLTGARFGAERAKELSLVHYVVEDVAALDAKVTEIAAQLAKGGPNALAACKTLAMTVMDYSDDEAARVTSKLIADLRASEEGREGMASFLMKRPAKWCSE
jgi:methylglutaconyl-CoA hydratase